MKAYEIYINDGPGQVREIEIDDTGTQLGEDATHVCAVFSTRQECLDWQRLEREIHESVKLEIIEEILKEVSSLPDIPGLCIHAAGMAAKALNSRGIHAQIQAGSLQWPMVRRCEDDGAMDTHFAYMWSPGSLASLLSVWLGQLPEMHVWAVIPASHEIVDFSTGRLRRAAERLGLAWTAGDPPEWLWCPEGELPDWVVYTPDPDATEYALMVLRELERASA